MRRSYFSPKIFGIAIRFDRTFPLLLLLVGFYYGRRYGVDVGFRAIICALGVFGCILGHELSHSLAAACFGVRVPLITLSLVGGVARMERIPRDPKKEFLITVAGPLFNVLLTVIFFYPLCWILGTRSLFSPTISTWTGTVATVFWANPMLAVFNLVPAFPMDGGRILRALLAGWIGYGKATQISAFLGCIFAILFVLIGILKHHGMLTVIGVFLLMSASREVRSGYDDQLRGDASRLPKD